jgi:hypothetical protein
MKMDIPDDIREKVDKCIIPVGLDGNHYRSTLRQYIEAALLAERLSATERAAKIAEGFAGVWPQERAAIAAAIRSQP